MSSVSAIGLSPESNETEAAAGDGGDDQVVDVDDEDDDEEQEAGSRKTHKMTDPCKPGTIEINEHEKTHLPYRNWCRHCVKGRGKEMSHTKSKNEHRLPEVHLDFCFVGREGEPGETLPVLVVREGLTKMVLASAVPSKSTGTFIARRVVEFLREIGLEHNDIVVKSDQEPAITTIVSEVGRVRLASGNGKYIVEQSPVKSSQSNGIVERGIQSVQQQIRVMKYALESRWHVDIPNNTPDHDLVSKIRGESLEQV